MSIFNSNEDIPHNMEYIELNDIFFNKRGGRTWEET